MTVARHWNVPKDTSAKRLAWATFALLAAVVLGHVFAITPLPCGGPSQFVAGEGELWSVEL